MFSFLGVPQRVKLDPIEKLRFIDGSMKHLLWQMMCLEAGVLTDIEVPISIPKYRLLGSIDGGNEDEKFGMELKTTGAWNWFIKNGPSLAHRLQVHSYFLGKSEWDKFSLIYWDTQSRETKEHVFYRLPQYTKLVKVELEQLNEAVDHQHLPEVLDECKKGKGKTFQGCPYAHFCLGCKDWDEAEANGTLAQIPTRRRVTKPNVNSGRTRRVHGRSAGSGGTTNRVVRRKPDGVRKRSVRKGRRIDDANSAGRKRGQSR